MESNEVKVVNEVQIRDFDKLIDLLAGIYDILSDQKTQLQQIENRLGSILTELNAVRTFDRPKLMKKLDEIIIQLSKGVTY